MASNKVARLYGDFRGIDLRSEECSLQRSPDCLNMWKDYRKETGICTRPTFERLLGFNNYSHINSLSFFKNYLMVHADANVLYCDISVLNNIKVESLYQAKFEDAPSQCFVFDDVWYIKTENLYWAWDGENTFNPVEGYVPTTSIARTPQGDGEVHENVNLLSGYRKNTFIADGSAEYRLDAQNISRIETVKVNGQKWENYTENLEDGVVTFFGELPQQPDNTQDNVEIEFVKMSGAEKILGCSLVQVFDNRVFFSGNPQHPNKIWHSAVNDPTYVKDLDYYTDGRDEAEIRALVAGNDALWVFREPSDENTTVFYHRPVLDADSGKVYPAEHSNISTGCVGRAINFNDDIVFFSERGMEGASSNIATEQAIEHRSSLVDRELIASENYKDMVLVEWEGYLMVIVGTMIYLADSRGVFSNDGHREYEWFRWNIANDGAEEMGKILCAVEKNGTIYLGDDKGTVWFMHGNSNVTSYWTTPKDKFKNPNRLKTTNKRGCVVEATGDVAVYAKTEDTEFELIADEKDVTDYFVPRIKQKKFKDIQLKFQSDTGFTLDSATLECYIGGYIKR